MRNSIPLLLLSFLTISLTSTAQYELPDSTALEGVIVEAYYVSDTLDVTDEDGGLLDTCSVTYRIFVDMKPGYELQAVYGNENNLLQLQTSTVFFNNEDRGEEAGDLIGDGNLEDNTVAVDSWVSMGAASESHFAVLKENDMDGSIVGGANNDGGSEGIDGGLLVNDNDFAGIPLTEADGLVEAEVPTVTVVGLDLEVFGDENAGGLFETNGGAWSVLEGVQGIDDDNVVLVAQITTQGEFSFRLNLQLGIPEEFQCNHPDCHSTMQFVAELHPDDAIQSVATDNIFFRSELTYVSEELICYPGTDISVNEIDQAFELNLFPNPVSQELSFSFETAIAEQRSLTVYSSVGQLVLTENIGTGSAKLLDVSSLESGMYVMVVEGESGRSYQQFIKE